MTQLLQNFSNHFSNLPWATQFAMLGIFAFAFGLVASSFFVRRAIGPMVEDESEAALWTRAVGETEARAIGFHADRIITGEQRDHA